MTKLIAIIGRPNVGKSTLFNRLAGKRLAIVDDQPGVTRDRKYAPAELGGEDFTLIDTAGMEEVKGDALEARMLAQTKEALMEADLVLLVMDARAGILPADEHFAQMVRRANKQTVLVLNKAESRAGQDTRLDAYRLGLGEPVLISAEHGEGMGDLFDAMFGEREELPREKVAKQDRLSQRQQKAIADAAREEEDIEAKSLQIAILGRPNAGKSTLINALIAQDRLLTGPEAGITRDAIAVPFSYGGRNLTLVDTAGIRKKANVVERLEGMAVGDSLRALKYAQVAVILMDATMPLEKQDATLAALVEREGRACVLGLSKWDLIKDKSATLEEIRYQCESQLPQLKGITIVPVSAVKDKGLEALMDACFSAYDIWNRRVGTAELNRWLEDAENTHTPPLVKGRRLKLKYMTQGKTRPPTFTLFTNIAKDFPDSYMRYLVNGLRQTFDLPGTPIRVTLKASKNPFEGRNKK
jgi:GTP-binding protein